MLCPWREADAMFETVVVTELYIGPLSANSMPGCGPTVALYHMAFDVRRLR